ncbi:acidstable alpha-amylase [Raphidocelis subcapitata]|uniref:Acidstable alpha-amylase n=1 Tax=Raphidocelis subcapitata TaxID=307507 RepID=A0A2V0PI72_9CHLO|nr:acidstable alpha-amylase [Raphidocelis subcapitata]|eukprot:GBF97600.1 acidstable alpha-amylase [Raphidocelis subcapitata]
MQQHIHARRPPAAAAAQRAAAVLLLLALPAAALAADAGAWRERVIYQIMIDRRGAGAAGGCGTLAGAARRFDYLGGLGVDAVWVGPVAAQCPGERFGATAYHGYWARDLYQIEPHFGCEEDLSTLVNAAHGAGFLVMLDVAANHMGDCGQLNPFSSPSHFHDCSGCDASCSIPSAAFASADLAVLEHCRLGGLPDLNQSEPFVRAKLLDWVSSLARRGRIDGLRLDAAAEMPRPFLRALSEAAGVFTLGEVWFSGLENVGLLASFAGAGGADSVLSYPLQGALRAVYGEKADMRRLLEARRAYEAAFPPQLLPLLGVFIENHDNPRFLSYQPDAQLYKNALTYVLLAEGIPIVYYGSEQGLSGGRQPPGAPSPGDGAYRQPLWEAGFVTSHPLYRHIGALARHRKEQRLWEHPQIEAHAAPDCHAFLRGRTLVVTTNAGGASPPLRCSFPLPPGAPLPFEGRLRNVLDRSAGDAVMDLGSRTVDLQITQGSPLVLAFRPPPPPRGQPGPELPAVAGKGPRGRAAAEAAGGLPLAPARRAPQAAV